MSLNKKNLLAATIGGLLLASTAQAQVVLGTDPALRIANERLIPTVLDAGDASAANDVVWTLGYNFSNGEVRYGSLRCTNNIDLTATGVTVTADPTGGTVTLGAINGNGSEVLFFSLTGVVGAGDETAAVEVSIDVDATLTDYANVNCEFGIYDTPSQAQTGSTTGNIFRTGFQPYITRANSYVWSATAGVDTADVEANPAFTQFIAGSPLVGDFNNNLTFQLVPSNVPLDIDLAPITLDDIFAATTQIRINGDFSAADDVTWDGVSPTTLTTSAATWTYTTIGALGRNDDVDYEIVLPNTTEIQLSNYSAVLTPVVETGYRITHTNGNTLAAGEINRNGTELLAPLAQIPTGYLSRVVLHNTGSVSRTFQVELIPAQGGSASEGDSTFGGSLTTAPATIAAGETLVLSVADLFPAASFTGAPRGTIKVTAEAPRSQMNGLYQIVNPANGSISNHVMVAPGTN